MSRIRKHFDRAKTSFEKSEIRIILGSFLLVLGAVLIFFKPISRTVLSYSFATEPVQLVGFEKKEEETHDRPTRIVVDGLKIDLEVSEAKVVDGYWEVFEDKAGWGEGSGFPGEPGNEVIFAHARKGLFSSLKKAKAGMIIKVIGESGEYEYEINEIKTVKPNETEVISQTEDEMVTLYTCSGFDNQKRLIVTGKRI